MRARDGSLYTGVAKDGPNALPSIKLKAPNVQIFKGRGPLVLVYQEAVGDKSAALKREYALKQLSKSPKKNW